MSSCSEKETVAGCVSGDQKLCRKLYDQYNRYVAIIVRNMVGECEDVRDLTQQVFLQMFGALSGFEGKSSLKTWLAHITRNLCLNFLAKKRRRREERNISADEIDEDGNPAHEFEDDSFNPGLFFEKKEARAIVSAAMESLSESKREAFTLHMAGLSYVEIGKITHTPIGTVGTRICNARLEMRKMLATYMKVKK